MTHPLPAEAPAARSQPSSVELTGALLKAGLLVLVVGGGYFLARSLGFAAIDRATARAWASEHAFAAPAFVLGYALLTVVAVPGVALTLACGFTFGLAEGSAVALLGANLGANGAFLLGRALGRDAVARLLGAKLAMVEARLREGGAAVIVTLRLLPFVPFTAINLAAAVVPGVSWRDFALGTAVGIVPGTVAYTAIGEAPDPTRREFWIGVAAVQLIAALPIGWRIYRFRRERSKKISFTSRSE